MTVGLRFLPDDAPPPFPPRAFALTMFGLVAAIALLGARLVLVTWETSGLPPTDLYTSIGLVTAISLGV